jgi:hypothetical protein
MKKLVIAAIFTVACAGTAFAAAFPNPFYVAIDRSTGRCVMMQFMGAGGPGSRYHVMGTYGSMRSAHRAMTHMAGCH